MSLAIDVDRVCQVLLKDGWHMVEDDSFEIDAYEYIREADGSDDNPYPLRLGGGEEELLPSRGARWSEQNGPERFVVSCPLTAILAVRERVAAIKHKKAKSA
jgi:hypothetical protein